MWAIAEMNKINFTLGKPINGWLNVRFKSGEVELKFEASNIPENPILELYQSLIFSMKGLESKVYWNLEPENYCFKFSPKEQSFNLTISENKKNIFSQDGSFESIILPFYRALKKFNSTEFKNENWTKLENGKIKQLTKLVAEKKTAHNNA